MKRNLVGGIVLVTLLLLFFASNSTVEAGKVVPTKKPRPTHAAPTSTRPETATPAPTVTQTATPTGATPTNPAPTPTADPANPHAGITKYEGPQTCIACHPTQGDAALHSEHVQWKGKWTQVNTYCTAPQPADYACLSCHATTGKVSNLTASDVDCLVCHSNTYQRQLGPLNVALTVTDWQGNQKTYLTPQKNSQGNYQFMPRYDLMPPGTTMESLAQNVQLPDRKTCLRCHAGAGGSDGAKRGDISSANVNPSYESDVHMSPSGANMVCQECHTTSDHKIAGRGIDLRVSEGAVRTCDSCHSARPHSNTQLDSHTNRVACQTCHIPTFAKDISTEMSRDWTQPAWNPSGCQGQGAWIGEEVRASNVIPAYTWWNGTSFVYNLANPIQPDANGQYSMAKALGSISDGKLYPIKVHTAVQPRHNASGRMVQYDVLWNFMTGFFEQAAQRGVQFMGLSGSYSWVTTRTEQLITHGVGPKSSALTCAACHETRSQVDLRTLGYTLKDTKSATCSQCHNDRPLKPFYDIHNKHVTDKQYDCSWCHDFSRPERGLIKP